MIFTPRKTQAAEGDEPDDDEEDEEEDADEDDEEPKLKYQRLGNSVPEILKRESASAIHVHERFIALGTQEGWIYILDFNGNEIRRFGAHTAVVNCLSVDKVRGREKMEAKTRNAG